MLMTCSTCGKQVDVNPSVVRYHCEPTTAKAKLIASDPDCGETEDIMGPALRKGRRAADGAPVRFIVEPGASMRYGWGMSENEKSPAEATTAKHLSESEEFYIRECYAAGVRVSGAVGPLLAEIDALRKERNTARDVLKAVLAVPGVVDLVRDMIANDPYPPAPTTPPTTEEGA